MQIGVIVLLILLVFNILDYHLTLLIIENGGAEINPFMEWAINNSIFGEIKYIIVPIFILILYLTRKIWIEKRYLKGLVVKVTIVYGAVVVRALVLLREVIR